MQKWLFILLIFTQLGTYGQTPKVLGFVLPKDAKKITIPIEIKNNLIIMPVVVNGQLPLRFILDTGVRTAILTEKSYSDILGLPYTRQFTISGPGGEHFITAFVANGVSFFIPPGVSGDGHALLVLEKDYLELRNYLGAEVHGVLGYEIFSRFVVEIDYYHKQLTLYDPAIFKAKKKFKSLPITIEDTKPFVVTTGQIPQKKPLKLLIDTGASHSLMLDPQSDTAIHVPQKHINTILGRALGGEITGKMGRINSLELGPYVMPKVVTNYPDKNSYMDTLKASAVKRHGTIGGEIISRFTVIFDYSHGKIYFRKNPTFKAEFQTNLSGLTIKAKGARLRVFEITEVRQGSYAHKEGIEKGDLLVSINGKPAASYELNELNGELNLKSGKRVSITVDRGGEKISRMLILEPEF